MQNKKERKKRGRRKRGRRKKKMRKEKVTVIGRRRGLRTVLRGKMMTGGKGGKGTSRTE